MNNTETPTPEISSEPPKNPLASMLDHIAYQVHCIGPDYPKHIGELQQLENMIWECGQMLEQILNPK